MILLAVRLSTVTAKYIMLCWPVKNNVLPKTIVPYKYIPTARVSRAASYHSHNPSQCIVNVTVIEEGGCGGRSMADAELSTFS